METSFNTENRTIETNTEVNNYNDMTLQLISMRIVLLLQIITTVIMISITVTIETMLSETHIT